MSDTIPTTSGIYTIINNINGRLYIGSAVNLKSRKDKHFWALAKCCHYNRYLQNAVVKYGLDAFSFHVIELVDDKSLLIQREQFYIDETESYKVTNGYNLYPTAGSSLGARHSDETRAKISDAHRGKKNPMFGKHLIGKNRSDETRAKISLSLLGKKHSDETKEKISIATRGEKHPMWGKPCSDNTKAKISAAKRGRKLSSKYHKKLSEAQSRRWNQYYAERDKLQLLLDF